MLVLPAEPPDAGLTRCLQDGNIDRLAMNPAFADLGLPGGNGEQGTVVDCLDKTISQRVQRSAQRSDVFADRDVLLRFGHDRSIVDEGTAGNVRRPVVNWHDGVHEVPVGIAVSYPKLGELAGA